MISFQKKRQISLFFLLLGVSGLGIVLRYYQNNLVSTGLGTGIILFGLVLFLASFNLRKKIPILPLGRGSTWLRIHIYIGWFSIAVFLFHIDFKFPTGGLELVVGGLFALTALSGVFGAFLSRFIPLKLTDKGGSITFERIPRLRRNLRQEVEKLVFESIELTKKNTIADFYTFRLAKFFVGTHNFWNHVFSNHRHVKIIFGHVNALKRYLNEEEKKVLKKIELCIYEKDKIDFHHSLLYIMRCWLFIHVPLTYALILFGIFHGVVAYQMSGGQF